MLKFFSHLKRNKVPTLIVLALCLCAYFIFFNSKRLTPVEVEYQYKVDSVPEKSQRKVKRDDKKTVKVMKVDPTSKESKDNFSFQFEAQKVSEMANHLPQSRKSLLEIIIKKDIFKAENVKVEAHTKDEITQNQMGAIKVLALKALLESDASSKTIKSDLDYIIQNSQDPTIIKIANAALESVDKGRSFFNDFIDGI